MFLEQKEPFLINKQTRNRLIWIKERKMWTYRDRKKLYLVRNPDFCVDDYRKRIIHTKAEAFTKDYLKRTIT